jgi:hypothetical protein
MKPKKKKKDAHSIKMLTLLTSQSRKNLVIVPKIITVGS